MVQWCGGTRNRGEESLRGEQVPVRNVTDVGKVEDVGVVAELDVGFAGVVGAQEAGEELDVAFAEDAGRPDRRGDKLGVVFAVGLDDDFFGSGLYIFQMVTD